MSNKVVSNGNDFITPQRKQDANRPKRKLPSTKANAAFKSPLSLETIASKKLRSDECLLSEHEKAVDGELCELEQMGCCEHELQAHIDLLHEYNEIKDTAQRLIGLLAVHKSVTTRELYPVFGLDIDD